MPGNDAHPGRELFWISFGALLYTYVGYPLALWLVTRGRKQCTSSTDERSLPTINLIVAAREEAGTIEQLLCSCADLDYPHELVQLTVVVTGEPEVTTVAVESCRSLLEGRQFELRVLHGDPTNPSKAAALNLAVSQSQSDVLVFTDANVRLHRQAIRALVRCFATPAVGAVSGRKCSLRDATTVSTGGDRAYWSYEAFIKHREALLASAAGADGALYAVRRDLYRPTANRIDDLAISLAIVRQGRRIAFAREALAYESSTHRLRDEFRRRVRTLSSGLELLVRSPQLFSPKRPVFAWILFSHKLMRYVAAYGLVGMLIGSARAKGRGYRAVMLAQLLGYVAAVLGGTATVTRRVGAGTALPLYGLTAQVAAIVAPFRLLRRQPDHWTPTPRQISSHMMGAMDASTDGDPPVPPVYREDRLESDFSSETAPARPDAADSSVQQATCPALGLAEDRASHAMFSLPQHRCYAAQPSGIPIEHQQRFCLTPQHRYCPVFQGQPPPWRHRFAFSTRPPRMIDRLGPSPTWLGHWRLTALGLVGLIAVAGAVALARPHQVKPRPAPGDGAAIQSSPAVRGASAAPTVAATQAPLRATSTPAAITAPPTFTVENATPGPRRYTVQPGEGLSDLAERFGVSLAALAAANNLSPTASLEIGQALIVPATPAPVTPTTGR